MVNNTIKGDVVESARLVFIHGINNEGKSADIIRSEWGGALNKGMSAAGLPSLELDQIECPYYGDDLYAGAKKWSNSRDINMDQMQYSDPELKNFEKELREVFTAKALVEITEESALDIPKFDNSALDAASGNTRGIDVAAVQQYNLQADIQKNGTRAANAHKGSLIKVAKFLESVTPVLVENVIGRFLAQSMAYLKDEALRDQINNKVISDVFFDESQKDTPHIVVTHSHGTLLSYFLFINELKNWNIKAWYTIGSPLGSKSMKKFLPQTDRYPGRVKTWYHCWDKEDFVAFDAPITKEETGIDGVVNINTFDTAYEDKHSIASYLSHAMLARLIDSDLRN